MTINSALFVREIRTHDGGQIDLIDVFDEISPESVPVILETLSLFIDMEVVPTDFGKRHSLELLLVDEEGKPIHVATPIRFNIPPQTEFDRRTIKLDPTLFNVKFERYGSCYMELRLDGAREAERRLYLGILPPME